MNSPVTTSSGITDIDIEVNLMISKAGSPPLNILICTSGVKRLSDFMLWQVHLSTLSHEHCLTDKKCPFTIVLWRHTAALCISLLARFWYARFCTDHIGVSAQSMGQAFSWLVSKNACKEPYNCAAAIRKSQSQAVLNMLFCMDPWWLIGNGCGRPVSHSCWWPVCRQ